MADYDDIQKLILQVIGEQELKGLTEKLKEEKQALLDVQKQFEEGALTMPEYGAEMRRTAGAIQETTEQLKIAQGQLEEGEEKGLGFKMRGGMRGELVLAHAFRELTNETATLTQKMESLARSLPYILSAFGVGGPWGTAFALAATAVVEVTTHWDHLMDILGDSGPLDAAKRLEEMAERTKATIDDYKKMLEIPDEFEKASREAIQKAFGGKEAERLKDQVLEAMRATATAPGEGIVADLYSPDTEARKRAWAVVKGAQARVPGMFIGELSTLQEGVVGPGGEQMTAQARADLARAINRARAQEIVGGLVSGVRDVRDTAMQDLQALVNAQPRAFGPRMAERLEEMTPAGQQIHQEQVRVGKNQLDQQVRIENARADHFRRTHRTEEQIQQLEAQGDEDRRKLTEQRDRVAKTTQHKREIEQRKQFEAGTPSAARLHELDREQLIREAMMRQTRAQQEGGFRPGEQQRMQRLAERLGQDFPTVERMQMMQAQAQAGLVSNQASLHERLKFVEQTRREIERVGRESQRQAQKNVNGAGNQ